MINAFQENTTKPNCQ